MIWRGNLGRQILLSMAGVTMTAFLFIVLGLYVSFGVLLTFFPELVNEDGWWPSSTEFLVLAGLACLALLIAGLASLKLAARLLVPIDSLAESARRIAKGDFAARAVPGDKSLGETAQLVTDFNTMAQRLQDSAEDMAAWNAAIAHELRSPLTILRGTLQGVADGVFVLDEQRLTGLLLQTEGLSRLVDDLRVVTLAGNKRLDLHIAPVEVSVEIRRVVDLTGPSLAEAGLTVVPTLVDIVVDADGVRIRQALLALLENARRYAEPGRVEITTLVSEDAVIIRVEDDGPGLPPDFAKRAFEPFTRGDGSRSRRSGGSGLGLSVVRAIAEAHGGSVLYRRTSRGGSAFELSLPRRREERAHQDTGADPSGD
jgi:two-component system sensor histidine kinase AdeS